ncbi:MAG: sugar transferase [Nocardioidaceae bacterium]|nr:sugar transferase [Nocardioidaceae bacterium]
MGTTGVGAARRTLDVLGAALLLVLTAPVLLVAALAVLVGDGRPVCYRQPRVGEAGRVFAVLKLRTMRAGAPGAAVTADGDPRITRVGAVLRRTSVDELPQLWNVLRGLMTLVGPRPESVALARRYPAACRPVLAHRPGLTGPAQLSYRERSAVPPAGWADAEAWYLTVVVPLRIEADLEYLHRPTLVATLRYLLLTALFVVGLADLQRPVVSRDAGTALFPVSDGRRVAGRRR